MASPRSATSSRSSVSHGPRYRRSSFNGAKRLSAAHARSRRVLILVGLLLLALVAALAVVAIHLTGSAGAAASN